MSRVPRPEPVGQGPAAAAFAVAAALWLVAPAPAGPTPSVSATAAPASGPARLLFGAALDPNRAGAATLEVLPGIGPARAAAILAARCEHAFASVSDLERVPGIGSHTLERIAPMLRVSGASPTCVQ
ncbi:MAG: hypothetical protein GY772_03035 [bacterium]|nr:hypothetical protein [bacterium]